MGDKDQPLTDTVHLSIGDEESSSRSSSPGIAFHNVFSDVEDEEEEEEQEEDEDNEENVGVEEEEEEEEVYSEQNRVPLSKKIPVSSRPNTENLDLNESSHRQHGSSLSIVSSGSEIQGRKGQKANTEDRSEHTLQQTEENATKDTFSKTHTDTHPENDITFNPSAHNNVITDTSGFNSPVSDPNKESQFTDSKNDFQKSDRDTPTTGSSLPQKPNSFNAPYTRSISVVSSTRGSAAQNIIFPPSQLRTDSKDSPRLKTVTAFHESLKDERETPENETYSVSRSFNSFFNTSEHPLNVSQESPQSSGKKNMGRPVRCKETARMPEHFQQLSGDDDFSMVDTSFTLTKGLDCILTDGVYNDEGFDWDQDEFVDSLPEYLEKELELCQLEAEDEICAMDDMMHKDDEELGPVLIWDGRVSSDDEELPPFYQSSSPKKAYRRPVMPKKKSSKAAYQTMMLSMSPLTMFASLAKEQQTDVAYLMENSSDLGYNMNFPCFQCYEKMETSSDYGMGDSYSGLLMDSDTSGSADQKETRCRRCGGQLLTMASFGKMLREMRKTFTEKDLVPHDVYPDGNCLFATVADQLRIRGEFRYTIDRLRQASVEHLKQNPCAEDGTRYEMFLSDETWNQYLERMSKDGIWGDHLVLNALANILKRRIVIYGGMTGQMRTVINPKGHSQHSGDNQGQGDEIAEDENKGEGQGSGKNENKSNSRTHSEGQTKEGTSDKEEECQGQQREGQGHKEGSEIKGAEKGDAEDEESDIVLGHVGESHYLSLRKRDWKSKLLNMLEMKTKHQESQPHERKRTDSGPEPDPTLIDRRSQVPLPHLSFLVKLVRNSKTIRSSCSESYASGFEVTIRSKRATKMELVGNPFDNLHPCCSVETFMPDITVFFPEPQPEVKPDYKPVQLIQLLSPEDTRAVSLRNSSSAKSTDLLVEEVVSLGQGYVHLSPMKDALWKGKTVEGGEGRMLLKPFTVKSILAIPCLTWAGGPLLPGKSVLAFACLWPEEAKEWISRERLAKWPSSSLVDGIMKEGCSIISLENALLLDENKELDDQDTCLTLETASWQGLAKETVWMVTFEGAVMTLSRNLSDEQRISFFILKMFVDFWMKDDKYLPISVLRSVFFRACERFAQSDWEVHSGKCLMDMLATLHKELQEGFLPCYFMQERNLLKHCTRQRLTGYCRKLHMIRSEFLICFYFFMDFYKLLETELTSTFDAVVEDIFQFTKHRDVNRSLIETFIPLSNQVVQDHVYNGEYELALNALVDLVAETCSLELNGKETPLAFHLSMAMSNCNIGHQWCLAFYIDVKRHTNLTTDVCREQKLTPIVNLFGPEFVERFGDVQLPAVYSLHSIDFRFVVECANVLKELNEMKLLISSLRYFVEQIQENYPNLESFPIIELFLLWNIYYTLYQSYYGIQQEHEFRDCLGPFETLSNLIGSYTAYSRLSLIYEVFGDMTKSDKYARCAQEVGTGYPSSRGGRAKTVQSMMNMYY